LVVEDPMVGEIGGAHVGTADVRPCPKRAQTKWHDLSLGGSSWHAPAGQRLDQWPDQPSGLH
jgi:hypothetical protein